VDAQGRRDANLILAGRHPVLEALRAGTRPIDEVLLEGEAEGRHRDIWTLARQAGIRCGRAPRAALTALAGTSQHQGVVARVAARAYESLDALLAVPARRLEPALFLALDQVQDPGNLGNLLRTAEALGAHGAVLLRNQAAGLTPGALRSAAGALEHLAIARVGNLAQTLELLKREGTWIVGAVASGPGAVPPWSLDLRGPVTVVLGSEARGLRPLVARSCDALTAIPQVGRIASLNVAAAGAALLYEVRRQRAGRVAPGPPGARKPQPGEESS
jgi:23S rRNA (guanosine2251-2'-O)-methyltransferase